MPFAREAGADVTVVDLDDYDMPVYHGDHEAANGLPPAAQPYGHGGGHSRGYGH